MKNSKVTAFAQHTQQVPTESTQSTPAEAVSSEQLGTSDCGNTSPEPGASTKFHQYIVVRESGKIETPSFPHHITHDYIMSLGHIDGYHHLPNKVTILWSDTGSMKGMKRNGPVSNYLGFTVYGPCIFVQGTTLSAGLKPEQFDTVLAGLQNAREPEPEQVESFIQRTLDALGPVSIEAWAGMGLDLFVSNVHTTDQLYGFIRQISNAKKRHQYVARLNSIRKKMRAGAKIRTDKRLVIGYANEEV